MIGDSGVPEFLMWGLRLNGTENQHKGKNFNKPGFSAMLNSTFGRFIRSPKFSYQLIQQSNFDKRFAYNKAYVGFRFR
jgi:hypothetical protein